MEGSKLILNNLTFKKQCYKLKSSCSSLGPVDFWGHGHFNYKMSTVLQASRNGCNSESSEPKTGLLLFLLAALDKGIALTGFI